MMIWIWCHPPLAGRPYIKKPNNHALLVVARDLEMLRPGVAASRRECRRLFTSILASDGRWWRRTSTMRMRMTTTTTRQQWRQQERICIWCQGRRAMNIDEEVSWNTNDFYCLYLSFGSTLPYSFWPCSGPLYCGILQQYLHIYPIEYPSKFQIPILMRRWVGILMTFAVIITFLGLPPLLFWTIFLQVIATEGENISMGVR